MNPDTVACFAVLIPTAVFVLLAVYRSIPDDVIPYGYEDEGGWHPGEPQTCNTFSGEGRAQNALWVTCAQRYSPCRDCNGTGKAPLRAPSQPSRPSRLCGEDPYAH